MKRLFALTAAAVAAFGLAACESGTPRDASSEGGIPMGDFVLVGIGADAVPTRNVRLNLVPGGLSGEGPCNSYRGTLSTKFPAFRVQEMTWTDMSCRLNIETRLEERYFHALTQANQAVYEGGVLKLMGPTYLTFEPGRPATQEELQAAAAAQLAGQNAMQPQPLQ